MTRPKMEFVDSSSVEAVGYDADEREIYIQFIDGGTYAGSSRAEIAESSTAMLDTAAASSTSRSQSSRSSVM